MENYIVYSDGSCPTPKGEWGYGSVILNNDGKEVIARLSGGGNSGTNNIAELNSVIKALEYLPSDSRVRIYSDSKYVVNAFNKNWLLNWKNYNWRRKGGPIKNIELWKKLDNLVYVKHKQVIFIWIRGHDGNYYNEMADQIACKAMESFK